MQLRSLEFNPSRVARVLRWLCIVCFLGAAVRHGLDVAGGGWLPYRYAPLWLNAFWTALTLLDPLAALLLWRRPRPGAGLALAIMLTDVGVNTSWAIRTGASDAPSISVLGAQTLFLGVLIGGFPLLWSAPATHQRRPVL